MISDFVGEKESGMLLVLIGLRRRRRSNRWLLIGILEIRISRMFVLILFHLIYRPSRGSMWNHHKTRRRRRSDLHRHLLLRLFRDLHSPGEERVKVVRWWRRRRISMLHFRFLQCHRHLHRLRRRRQRERRRESRGKGVVEKKISPRRLRRTIRKRERETAMVIAVKEREATKNSSKLPYHHSHRRRRHLRRLFYRSRRSTISFETRKR